MLLSSYVDSDDVTNYKIYVGSTPKAMTGREKIQTFEYVKNEKSFLEEIKNIFHSS